MRDERYKSDLLRASHISSFIKGNEVLDIGSKEGNVNKILTNNHKNKMFFSLDNSGDADFKVDLDKPKKLNKKFDTIVAGEIIEHLESPIQFIRYCKSLLKDNGRIILTTPNATGIQYLRNPSWCVYYTDYRGHTQTFTIEMLNRILEDEGFKVVHKNYINAFWINNPLQYVSAVVKRLRPDLMIVADKVST